MGRDLEKGDNLSDNFLLFCDTVILFAFVVI